MNTLHDYAEKELEFDFYGFLVQDFISEVKVSLHECLNLAVEDSKKKVVAICGGKTADECFEIVKQAYSDAINSKEADLEAIINKYLKLTSAKDALNNRKVDESAEDEEIKDLKMQSAALDVYLKELLRKEANLLQGDNMGLREIKRQFDNIGNYASQLFEKFTLAEELFSGVNHFEQSFRNSNMTEN